MEEKYQSLSTQIKDIKEKNQEVPRRDTTAISRPALPMRDINISMIISAALLHPTKKDPRCPKAISSG